MRCAQSVVTCGKREFFYFKKNHTTHCLRQRKELKQKTRNKNDKKKPCKHLKTKQKQTYNRHKDNKQTNKKEPAKEEKVNEIDTKSVNPTENIDSG